MNPCAAHRERMSACLDAELTSDEELSMRAHLSECPECREAYEELARTRALLARDFEAVMRSAPPAPEWARRGPRPLARILTGIGVTAAAAVTAAFLLPRPTIDATPLRLLERAAAQHRELRDVELYATLDSGLVDLISKLSGKGKDGPKPHYRVVVKKPNRVVLHEVASLDSRKIEKDGERMGFDGERFWQYDPEKGAVRVGEPGDFEFRSGDTTVSFKKKAFGKKAENLLRYLSWDLVRTLADEAGKHDIVDITGPADRRTRRRVFRLEARSPDNGDAQWVWDQTEITIDPRQNLIERMVFDLKVIGLSMVRIELQLAEVNNGFRNDYFDRGRWVPPGTPVVEGK